MKRILKHATPLIIAMVMAAALFSALEAHPQRYDDRVDAIVIQRTIPYPNAVKRQPLTSDRLSTTSTRYIDARRGFRPFSSVDRSQSYHTPFFVGHEDHFGISRPEDRPISYALRKPRTYVTQYRNDLVNEPHALIQIEPMRALAVPPVIQAKPTKVRVHRDKDVLPETGGAVLITSDGRVIQIGN